MRKAGSMKSNKGEKKNREMSKQGMNEGHKLERILTS
jgi:hypothetical protein